MPEWYIPVAGNKMWWQVWGWISGSIIRRFECDLWKKRCLRNGGRKINMKIRILRRKMENSRHTEITIQEQEPENEISAEIIEIEKKKPKTSGCMKALGIICLIIFASAILDSCLFEWAGKRAAAPWPDDEVKIKKDLHCCMQVLTIKLVVGDGFEPSKSATADLQSAPFGRSGTPPEWNA